MSTAFSKKLIIANWKMNLDQKTLKDLVTRIVHPSLMEVVLCPPHVYLQSTLLEIGKHNDHTLKLGAQDCSACTNGPCTGDVSASMLADIGCQYVIIGHSERRILHFEDDDIIKQKIQRALDVGIKPIICVGEDASVKSSGETINYLLKQLCYLPQFNSDDLIIAYEPIWSIGSGIAIDTEELEMLFNELKNNLQINKLLYGGSVNEKNCREFLKIDKLDGLLVGGASLDSQKFNQIIGSSD